MSAQEARRRIIIFSLLSTFLFGVMSIVSPFFIQLEFTDAYRVLQIVFPVFAGYLGAGVIFLFRNQPARDTVADQVMLRYFVYGPFFIFWGIAVAVFASFYWSNLPQSTMQGMQVSELANYVTYLVSFMNVTVGALTAYLFDSEELRSQLNPPNGPK